MYDPFSTQVIHPGFRLLFLQLETTPKYMTCYLQVSHSCTVIESIRLSIGGVASSIFLCTNNCYAFTLIIP